MKQAVGNMLATVFPESWKKFAELRYWKQRHNREGELTNIHYKYFYTTHFDLDDAFFRDKQILDIGCGPRGSLEWADMAKTRVGLDPLADKYSKLGTDRHQMEYVTAGSEQMPFDSNRFDVVCAFNSLDHVSDLDKTISEIKRVTKSNGLFLLLVEINHDPTYCEPHLVRPDIIDRFKPEFQCLKTDVYSPVETGLYDSIRHGIRIQNPESTREPGWLSASFQKKR